MATHANRLGARGVRREAGRVWTVIGFLSFAGGLLAQQAQPATPPRAPQEHVDIPRDQWQRVPDVLRELDAVPGARIADIGAGHGYFTTRIAKAVGAEGRVYAVDVNPIALRELREAIGTEYPNVEIIRGDEDDPRLPGNRLDGALVVNAYHEFADHRAMLSRIRAALKPGGHLVIIEPIPRAEDTTRAAQAKRHAIAVEFAEADLRDAGFEVVTRDLTFVSRPEHLADGTRRANENAPTDWLLTARKPG